jgi:glycerol-3-phosphate O-acyltransferase
LKGRVFTLIAAFEQAGAYVHVPRKDRDYAIDMGLRMLVERQLIVLTDGTYVVHADGVDLLQYYANSLAHLRPAVQVQTAIAAE